MTGTCDCSRVIPFFSKFYLRKDSTFLSELLIELLFYELNWFNLTRCFQGLIWALQTFCHRHHIWGESGTSWSLLQFWFFLKRAYALEKTYKLTFQSAFIYSSSIFDCSLHLPFCRPTLYCCLLLTLKNNSNNEHNSVCVKRSRWQCSEERLPALTGLTNSRPAIQSTFADLN